MRSLEAATASFCQIAQRGAPFKDAFTPASLRDRGLGQRRAPSAVLPERFHPVGGLSSITRDGVFGWCNSERPGYIRISRSVKQSLTAMNRIGRASTAIRSEVEEKSVRSFSWRRLPQKSLSESIIAQVRQELFSGKLRPGDYLGTEASLSQSFGVSRMATRDAVRALHASGVIEARRGNGGGIRIAHGDPDRFADALAIQLKLVGVSVKEIVDAHVTIETAAAELAATRATNADLEGLQNHLNDLRELVKNQNLTGYIDHLLAFHLALARASHNRALSTLLRGYFGVLEDFYRGRASHAAGRRVVRYLGKILQALKDRDRERTRSHMLSLFRPLANFEDRADR